MVVLQENQRDWVAFESGRHSFEANNNGEGGRRKRGESARSRKSSSGRRSPWMKQPINADASWVPLPAPRERGSSSQSGNPSSPRIALQPVNPSPRRHNEKIAAKRNPTTSSTSSIRSERTSRSLPAENLAQRGDTPKPEAILESTHTKSNTTCSSSSSSEENRTERQRRSAPSPRGRSTVPRPPRDSPVSARQEAAPLPPRRRRSISAPRPSPRERSNSLPRASRRERSNSSTRGSARGRSSSRTREPKTRSRSTSRQRSVASAPKRGRSTSRPRPPRTRSGRDQRARSRSASLTRVTSPVASPAKTHSGASSRDRRKPPSTYRTLREMKVGGSSNSIGPGIRPRSASDETSSTGTADANIGRNIRFEQERRMSSDSDIIEPTKKRSIREKLFGDHVCKSSSSSFRFSGSYSQQIRPRILLAATVYHNTATSLWITTINTNQRGVAKNPALANKFLKAFSFPTEREARESAIANAPPKMIPFNETPHCFMCQGTFAIFRRASHCRNCGICICGNCSTTWPAKMIPETYNLKKESSVKICKGCDFLSSSFKKALLGGDYEEAVALYGTGNVNLRTPFPVSSKKDEVMHPVHCAVEGGNIDIVRWLIDDHYCPIKLVRAGAAKKKRGAADVPIQTSKGRTVLSIAMECLKVDIMRYLVVECNVSIHETTDLKSALRGLEAALLYLPKPEESILPRVDVPVATRWDKASFDDISEPSSLGESERLVDDIGTIGSRSRLSRNSRNADSCIICCDRKIDCVATPCGHQVCCLECSANLASCPVCNNKGDFIRIFRP